MLVWKNICQKIEKKKLMRLHSTFFQGQFALDQEEQLPHPKLFRDFWLNISLYSSQGILVFWPTIEQICDTLQKQERSGFFRFASDRKLTI